MLYLSSQRNFLSCPCTKLPLAGDSTCYRFRKFGQKPRGVKSGAEILQTRQVWGVIGLLQQNAAVLKDGAKPTSLSAADDLMTTLMDNIVGVASEKTQKVFRIVGGSSCRGGKGVTAESAGDIAADQQVNQRQMHSPVEF